MSSCPLPDQIIWLNSTSLATYIKADLIPIKPGGCNYWSENSAINCQTLELLCSYRWRCVWDMCQTRLWGHAMRKREGRSREGSCMKRCKWKASFSPLPFFASLVLLASCVCFILLLHSSDKEYGKEIEFEDSSAAWSACLRIDCPEFSLPAGRQWYGILLPIMICSLHGWISWDVYHFFAAVCHLVHSKL